jgi:hypothetical protein
LYNYIDSLAAILEVPSERHYQRWPILGNYVWPNNFVGNTYQEEITYLKSWINDRLTWMDANMFGVCDTAAQIESLHKSDFNIYPNPTKDVVYIESPNERAFQISVFTAQGTLLKSISNSNSTRTSISFENLPKGMYFIQIKTNNQVTTTQKIIVQ